MIAKMKKELTKIDGNKRDSLIENMQPKIKEAIVDKAKKTLREKMFQRMISFALTDATKQYFENYII